MKTRILLLLNLVFLVGGTDVASAFYDPTVGRWLNRDLIGEKGFETVARDLTGGRSDDFNLYAFVGNDPVDHVDALGMITYKCPNSALVIAGKGSIYTCVITTGRINFWATACNAKPLRDCILASIGIMNAGCALSNFAVFQFGCDAAAWCLNKYAK